MVSLNRSTIQIAASLITNAHLSGFLTGNIYRGSLKKVCVPGLNCYSCPGAMGSCPVGALQTVSGSINYTFSLYVAGFLMLTGTILGRLVCGWLCPFGFIQELLYKIRLLKLRIGRADKLKYLKYVILLVFVLILPAFWVNKAGLGDPAFCKYICPAGTMEGGIPLVLLNESLRTVMGYLFIWKLVLLVITIILSIMIFRPFCRFICPLGAIYALFNSISLYRLEVDAGRCNRCGTCLQTCKMNVKVYEHPNDPECIRCLDCINTCPQKAISSKFTLN